jgi:RNA ligase (TIGR02306 family)
MWDVKIHKVNRIEPIPNADRLEVAFINDWPVVVQKGQWSVGQLSTYVPYDSVLPANLIESLGLVGKLSGSQKNRVKAIRLRQQLSIGLLAPVPDGFAEGDSVAEFLGVTKYEEVLPPIFGGQARSKPQGWLKYDIENSNNTLDGIIDNDEVVILEKIHGCNGAVGLVDNEFIVSSRNLCLKDEGENIYWKIAKEYKLEKIVRELGNNYWLHFEIYGGNIQDLSYGLTKPSLSMFDIRNANGFLNYENFVEICRKYGLPTVSLLYRGPFSKSILTAHTSGFEMVSGRNLHIREGCVVKPVIERLTRRGERVIYKSVSPDYLLRKNGTEFH